MMVNSSLYVLFWASFYLALFSAKVTSSMEVEKRAPFNAWAGKRSSQPSSSSYPLHSRADLSQILRELNEALILSGEEPLHHGLLTSQEDEEYTSENKRNTPFNSWAGKRAPFNSWAGKRSLFLDQEDEEDLKAARYKRASEGGELMEDPSVRKYTKMSVPFSAWGGKRMGGRVARNVDYPSFKVMRPVRAVFSAWGGK